MESTLWRLGSATPAVKSSPSTYKPASGLRFAVPVLCACAALAPARAHAYATDVHTELTRRALAASGLADKATPIDLATVTALRTALDTYARSSPTLRDAWAKRYPKPADFDAFAEKQLLEFAAGASVIGIDRVDSTVPKDATLLELIARACSQPDDDYRNRERLAYNDKRQPISDTKGKPVPADPALLNMGNLGALSSQAHAHYGLAQVEQSADPEILKSDPRRFASRVGYEKVPVMTLAAEMTQIHIDLALAASLADAPTSRELGWQFVGQGFHYLEDVGNQAHTVQVGLYDFFVDAFMERIKLGLLTGGGYLGQMQSLGKIGVGILTRHHVLGEELTRKRMMAAAGGNSDAVGQRLLLAPTVDDPDFSGRLDTALARLGPTPERGEFALIITRELIEVSSHEGEALYRATRAIAAPQLRHYNATAFNDEGPDPDKYLVAQTAGNEAAYRDFWSLQERAFRRVGTAERRVIALYRKALLAAQTPEAKAELQGMVMQRLLQRQLTVLSEVDARLADYLQNPPPQSVAPERSAGLLAADIAVAVLLLGIVLFIIRSRRRQQAD